MLVLVRFLIHEVQKFHDLGYSSPEAPDLKMGFCAAYGNLTLPWTFFVLKLSQKILVTLCTPREVPAQIQLGTGFIELRTTVSFQ